MSTFLRVRIAERQATHTCIDMNLGSCTMNALLVQRIKQHISSPSVFLVLHDFVNTNHRSHAVVERNPLVRRFYSMLLGFTHSNGVGGVVAGKSRASDMANYTLEIVRFFAYVFFFIVGGNERTQ